MKIRKRRDRGTWLVDFRIKGRRWRRSLPLSLSRKEAENEGALMVAEAHASIEQERRARLEAEIRAEIRSDLILEHEGRPASPTTWAASLVRAARSRAARRGLPCTIDHAHVTGLFESQDGRCELTGIPFDFAPHPAGTRRPFAPSIDRIDCNEGYTPQNCRLICAAVNIALSDWGEAVLRRIAESIVYWCPPRPGTNRDESGASNRFRTGDLQSHKPEVAVECEENQRVVMLQERRKGRDVA